MVLVRCTSPFRVLSKFQVDTSYRLVCYAPDKIMMDGRTNGRADGQNGGYMLSRWGA